MPLLPAGLAYLTWSLAELGEFADGLRHGEEAIRIAEDVGNVFSLIHAIVGLGLVSLRQGEVGKATVTLERGLDICRSANLQTAGFHGVASFLGETYALAGRPDDATPLLQRVTDQSLALGMVADFCLAAVPLGNAYMIAERHDDALRVAAQAADLSRKHDFRANRAWALRLLACSTQIRLMVTSRRRRASSFKGWLSLRNWGCARSRPTAIWVSESCIAGSGAGRRPAPSYQRRSACCARWG